MKSLRYPTRLLGAFIVRFRGIIILGIFFGVALFLVFSLVLPNIIGRTIARVGYTGQYQTDKLPLFIQKQISQGLTQVNSSGEAIPALAGSWKDQDNGKVWTFSINDNLLWSDDTPIDSYSINYQFSDVTIERPDNKTIKFTLPNEFAPFPVVVSRPTFKKGLLGIGDWEVNDLELTRNFVQELVLVNKAKQKKIIKFFPTEEKTKEAFKLGLVDKIDEIIDPTPFDEWDTVELTGTVNKGRYAAVFFNTNDPFLIDKTVRQAMTYAINKNSLGEERAISPISPLSWAYNPQVKLYKYDEERSRDIIDELPDEQKDDLSIKLATYPALLEKAEEIARYWEAIGIKTVVQVSSVAPQEYQAFLAIVDIPIDPDQYSLWHSQQEVSNISKLEDDRIDKLLEDGRSELEREARKKIYFDFQRFLVEEVPAAFLYHPTYYTIERK